MAKERIKYIDIARGIGIIAIVFCHACRNEYISKYLYSFQVPLFFFLSGFTYKYVADHRDFIKNKFRTILVPFYSVGLICILAYSLVGRFLADKLSIAESALSSEEILPNILWGLLYGNSKGNYMKWNTPLWFLTCLFSLQLVIHFIDCWLRKNEKDDPATWGIIAGISVIVGYVFSIFSGVRLPYHLETALSVMSFFIAGMLVRRYVRVQKFRPTVLIIGSIVLIGIGIIFGNMNSQVSVRLSNYGNYILYLIAAVTGTAGYFLLSVLIGRNDILEYVGRNSLVILLWHKIPLLVLQVIFNRLVKTNVVNTPVGYVFVTVSTVISIVGCLILDNIYNKIVKS